MYYKLGWYPETKLPSVGQKMKIENFAQGRLRENILCMMGQLHEDDFIENAINKFNDYINGKSDLSIGLLECVFRAYSNFPSSRILTSFDQLFKAIVLPDDAHTMLKEICKSPEGRHLVIKDLEKKFVHYEQKFHNFNLMYHFLKDIVESFSHTNQIENLEIFLSEKRSAKLLYQSLRLSFEKVRVLEQWKNRDQFQIISYFENENFDDSMNIEENVEDHSFFDFKEFH
ncbi:hypothetical protein BLOT_004072 [Blomia tropicalis]|nr:hypothetical protein BLOT_004072 [Blomia tropicalis]